MGVAACITGCAAAEVAEADMPVDGGGIPYSIVDVVTVLDPGRLTLTALLLEDILVTVEAAVADAEATAGAEAEAVGAANSVVPEESVCICS